jgi:hypothetical protein
LLLQLLCLFDSLVPFTRDLLIAKGNTVFADLYVNPLSKIADVGGINFKDFRLLTLTRPCLSITRSVSVT